MTKIADWQGTRARRFNRCARGVEAHGTALENDMMEFSSLSAALRDGLAAVPVSSNTSMIGHTLSAAGRIEAAISL